MESRNGYFQLVLKPEGTYLRLYPAVGDGEPTTYDEINSYLAEKRIYDYDIKALGHAITISKNQQTEVKLLSVTVLPESEYLKITISKDNMSALGKFYPPSVGGQAITPKEILNSLSQVGVRYGLVQDNIDDFFNNKRYCENIVLAKATKPVEGSDAIITYCFNTDNTLKPKENEDGTVDFHQLDIISTIKKGDILATLVPANEGTTGTDVKGNIIRPRKVARKILKHGKYIHLSEDGLTMYSDVSGHVVLTDDKVFVSDTYDVKADVDSSTGDIVYAGNVHVKGNVITGFSIQAAGDIIINGVVEGANLKATGHIILKRGMQGMSKGRMEAGGNIISKFIENTEVIAGGYVSTEAILHSRISAHGDVTVGGKKGFITGGEIRSATSITVKTAGSTMGTNTLLEVGIDPGIIDELHYLEKNISVMKSDMGKLLPVLAAYKKKISSGERLPADKIEYIKTATNNCIRLSADIKESTKRYEELKMEINSNENGNIRVQNVAYPGVKIVISNVNYFIKNEIHYSKFIRDKADIKVIGL